VDASRGNVTGLEINLDAEPCRVLDLGLHVIKVSPKNLSPSSSDIPRDRCAPSRHLDSSHFLRRKRFAPTAPPSLCKEVPYSVSSGNQKAPICSGFVFLKEPSDGLEPSIPSLPWNVSGNGWQPVATDFACFCGFAVRRFAAGCQRLQPRGSIKAPSLVVREGDSSPAREVAVTPTPSDRTFAQAPPPSRRVVDGKIS
jgi:hypothetical protein